MSKPARQSVSGDGLTFLSLDFLERFPVKFITIIVLCLIGLMTPDSTRGEDIDSLLRKQFREVVREVGDGQRPNSNSHVTKARNALRRLSADTMTPTEKRNMTALTLSHLQALRINLLENQIEDLEQRISRLKQSNRGDSDHVTSGMSSDSPLNTRTTPERVAYWPLNERGGDLAYDHSGNGYHAKIFGSVRQAQKGVLDTAYRFDGDGAYLKTEATDIVNFDRWSLSFWMLGERPDDSQPEQIFTQGSQNHIGFGNWARSFSYNSTRSPKGGRLDLLEDHLIRDGEFHHVVLVYRGNQLEVYVDGSKEVSREIKSDVYNWAPGDHSLFIGKDVDGSNFKGKIDDIRLFSGALSTDSVEDLYEDEQQDN